MAVKIGNVQKHAKVCNQKSFKKEKKLLHFSARCPDSPNMCFSSVFQIGICSVYVFVSVSVWHMAILNMWLIFIVFTYMATLVFSGEAAIVHASNKSYYVLKHWYHTPWPRFRWKAVNGFLRGHQSSVDLEFALCRSL